MLLAQGDSDRDWGAAVGLGVCTEPDGIALPHRGSDCQAAAACATVPVTGRTSTTVTVSRSESDGLWPGSWHRARATGPVTVVCQARPRAGAL